MFSRNANVWQITLNISLQSGETKRQSNCFILKFLMIKKNWAQSHNFRDIVELVDDCGEINILTFTYCIKNAKYLSLLYVSKYIEIMSNHMKQPLLEICAVIYIFFLYG